MNISIEEILDYCYCPLVYKFRYVDKIDSPVRLDDKYENDMHTIAYCFFHKILDGGKMPTDRYLKQRWNTIWDKRKTREEILHTSTIMSIGVLAYEVRRRYITGLKLIDTFSEYYTQNPGTPILVAKQYSIDFGKHVLSGTLELVRETQEDGKPIIEVVDFKVDPRNMHINTDLRLTAASYAFRKLFRIKEDRLVYHGLKTGIVIPTKRGNEDYKILLKIVNGIASAISQKIYYPVMNARCANCTYAKHCQRKDWLL